jgi:hypothetical protein
MLLCKITYCHMYYYITYYIRDLFWVAKICFRIIILFMVFQVRLEVKIYVFESPREISKEGSEQSLNINTIKLRGASMAHRHFWDLFHSCEISAGTMQCSMWLLSALECYDCLAGTGLVSPSRLLLECEAHRLFSSIVEDVNVRTFTAMFPTCLHGVC